MFIYFMPFYISATSRKQKKNIDEVEYLLRDTKNRIRHCYLYTFDDSDVASIRLKKW